MFANVNAPPGPMTNCQLKAKAEDIPAMLWQAHQGYHDLLGKPKDLVSAREQWKRLCLRWHPDKAPPHSKLGCTCDLWDEQAKKEGQLLFSACHVALARRRDAHAISCGPSAHAWIIFRGPCATASSDGLGLQTRPTCRGPSQGCGGSVDHQPEGAGIAAATAASAGGYCHVHEHHI